ncbi:EEF1A lysine methyltransferase 2 [Neocloeon triangulifer]|uniref:EEF1A lysine methyltransferase 2 n=1 Tax=Neocloeon triangulifer TaxID=2078957 RepID=UPI00286F5EEF|nr:EEF1A lysine methyltransferase 2 [Neocloeon triangulifer]
MDGDNEPCSELGTKEYWDKTYQLEINNFQSHGDVGEEWFGEDSAMRVVKWLNAYEKVTKGSKIIDIGCGNGMLLSLMAEEEYENLLGVDYSQHAINLASSVANKMALNISFKVWDILSAESCPGDVPFDVALDKGTYDAIGLSSNGAEDRKTYITKVHSILTPDGILVLTSCNYTEDELESQFSERFTKLSRIPAPTFKFGGREGSLISSLILRKIN